MAFLPLNPKGQYHRRSPIRPKQRNEVIAILVFVIVSVAYYSPLSFFNEFPIKNNDDQYKNGSPIHDAGGFVQELSSSRFLGVTKSNKTKANKAKAYNDNDSDQKFPMRGIEHHKRAIVMISFGESALHNPLLERAVLSIRRRGKFDGPVMVITDADLRMYKDVFDEKVYFVNAKEKDFNRSFTSRAMAFKRFKTLILDYIDMVPELDDVDFVYYMDMDVMLGAPFIDMIKGLHQTYGIESDPATDEDVINNIHSSDKDEATKAIAPSTLFFFKNFPQSRMNYYGCGGFFLMNRRTSRTCLDHWRAAIDKRPTSHMDQRSLTAVAHRIQSGSIKDCRLHLMELEHYVSYPLQNEDLSGMMKGGNFTHLIHIFNTGAKKIDDEIVEEFVADVLMLSSNERAEHKFGRNVITSR